MINILKKMYYKIFTKKSKTPKPWLSFYSEKENSIRFTKETIYNYLRESVGDDLDYYALNYFGTRITYGEMFRRINQISKSLLALGVKRRDIVTICMPNTPEAVMTFYAINKIGAVADMVHPLSAPNEVKKYLQDTGSRVLILYDANYEKYKDMLPKTKVYKTVLVSVKESMPPVMAFGFQLFKGFKIKKAPFMDRDYISWREFLSLGRGRRSIVVNASPRELALILHSGGTTGTPKGIMISNYNFNAEAQQGSINVRDVRPKDKIVTLLPIFHGFGLGVCLHCPLSLKVEAILVPEFENKRFAKIIKEYKPNVLAGVPTLWEAMMSSKNFEDIDLSSLKYIISGGDYLTVSMEKKMNAFLKEKGAKIKISKGYGMTESVAATAYTFNGANEPGSIGIPMVGNSFCICTPETTEEVPLGEEGEICVNGPTVMIGYYNNPKETEKVLRLHKDGEVWLHTGDIGYITEGGIIYFTQRLKRVIVSSGFNVYPSAIEEIIETHPLVKKACVIGVSHPYKMNVANAYVVLKEGVKPNIKIKAEISLLCKKNLAVYSLPKEIIFREKLPTTLYNKVDYKALEKEVLNERKKTS